jgi:hypothetical protein
MLELKRAMPCDGSALLNGAEQEKGPPLKAAQVAE